MMNEQLPLGLHFACCRWEHSSYRKSCADELAWLVTSPFVPDLGEEGVVSTNVLYFPVDSRAE